MAIGAPPRLLGEILVAEGLTTTAAIDRALARQRTTGELIGECLVAIGALNEDDVARALAVQQDLPYVWREELPSTVPVLKTVSAKYLRQYRVCPISIEGGVLTVASADPVSYRRHPLRSGGAAAPPAGRRHLPHQDHGRNEHRGAPAAAGRAHPRQPARRARRHPRLDDSDRARRVHRHAAAPALERVPAAREAGLPGRYAQALR